MARCSRRSAPRRSAFCFWRGIGVVDRPTGQPTIRLTGGAAARLAAITPAGMEAFIHLTIAAAPLLTQAFVILEAR